MYIYIYMHVYTIVLEKKSVSVQGWEKLFETLERERKKEKKKQE